MKKCKIKGIIDSSVEIEKTTDILLCDFCFNADLKRGDDAQVVSFEEYIADDNANCEVCFKLLKQERAEIKIKN